jgi:hypothetical protein
MFGEECPKGARAETKDMERLERGSQVDDPVPPMELLVEIAKDEMEALLVWDVKEEGSARSEDPGDLAHRLIRIIEMLQHCREHHHIEGTLREATSLEGLSTYFCTRVKRGMMGEGGGRFNSDGAPAFLSSNTQQFAAPGADIKKAPLACCQFLGATEKAARAAALVIQFVVLKVLLRGNGVVLIQAIHRNRRRMRKNEAAAVAPPDLAFHADALSMGGPSPSTQTLFRRQLARGTLLRYPSVATNRFTIQFHRSR